MYEIINNKYQPIKVFVSDDRSVALAPRNTDGSKRKINIKEPSAHMQTLQTRNYISFKKIESEESSK